MLDADESITPKLREELISIAEQSSENVTENGYYINRLTWFIGKPIRHCGYFPSYHLRFFKSGLGRYEEREVHEHVELNGPIGRIDTPMLHDDRRGLEHYVAKHNRYSTLEARALARELAEPVKESSAGARRPPTEMGKAKHLAEGSFPRIAPLFVHVCLSYGLP